MERCEHLTSFVYPSSSFKQTIPAERTLKNNLLKWVEEQWVHVYLHAVDRTPSSRRRADDADSAAAVTFPHCHANIRRSLWPAVALSAAISATVWPPSRLSEQRRRRRRLSGQSRRSAATARRLSDWTLQRPISVIVQCGIGTVFKTWKKILVNEGGKKWLNYTVYLCDLMQKRCVEILS